MAGFNAEPVGKRVPLPATPMNITVIRSFLGRLFSVFRCRRFTIAFLGSLTTILCFDVLWSMATSFRGLGFVPTYLYAVLLAILMALPSLLWRRNGMQITVIVIADLLALANLMYGRTYLSPIPPYSYLLVDNVAQFGDAIIRSLRWGDTAFLIITGLTAFLLLRSKTDDRGQRRKALRSYLCCTGLLVAVCAVYALCSRTPFAHIEKLKGDCYYHATPPVVYTLPLSIANDILESRTPVSEADRVAALRHLAEADSLRRAYPEATVAGDSVPDNIVFILVESLEAWPIGATVEGREITPNLNRYIAGTPRKWAATKVLSQVGPGRSIDGQLLTTAGMLPTMDKVYSMTFADNVYPHLSQALRRHNGARSYILSGDRATTWNEGAIAMRFGIDERRFRDQWDSSEAFGHPRNPSDGSLVRQIIAKMKSGEIWPVNEKAFVEIITYSSHFPFHIPEEYRKISLREEYPEPLGSYITAINYTDSALGELLDYITSRPDADRTMIVIVGDHEALGSDRAPIRDTSPQLAGLVSAEPFVPMIVLNAPHPGHRDAVMGQVDVYPTVLSQAGLTGKATFPGLGFSALSPLSPSAAVDPTGALHGDTTGISPTVLRLLRNAPEVSRTILRADLLATQK